VCSVSRLSLAFIKPRGRSLGKTGVGDRLAHPIDVVRNSMEIDLVGLGVEDGVPASGSPSRG